MLSKFVSNKALFVLVASLLMFVLLPATEALSATLKIKARAEVNTFGKAYSSFSLPNFGERAGGTLPIPNDVRFVIDRRVNESSGCQFFEGTLQQSVCQVSSLSRTFTFEEGASVVSEAVPQSISTATPVTAPLVEEQTALTGETIIVDFYRWECTNDAGERVGTHFIHVRTLTLDAVNGNVICTAVYRGAKPINSLMQFIQLIIAIGLF